MTKTMGAECKEYRMNYEETELRLGLPGGNGNLEDTEMMKNINNGNKRGFSETVDLKLNFASKDSQADEKEKNVVTSGSSNFSKPPAKKYQTRINYTTLAGGKMISFTQWSQVVGWPPVRSFRKNILGVQKNSSTETEQSGSNNAVAFVKVSVDGAPYLRKVDLKNFKSYQELSDALSKMFSSFTIDYVPTYEDKDGDWMLVGDVPWEMFVDSCKRLRIMKGSEAIGLAPRAVQKCKNRN